jgi:MFS family permease
MGLVMAAALRPLRLAGFPSLALAYIVNELGDWLGTVALAVLVFDQTGSPLATAALFLGSQFLPALVVPALVTRLEVLHPRRSLPALYAGEALAFVALAMLTEDFALAAVVAIAALDGAMAGSARALTRATAGAVLSPADQLREGNAILNIGFTVGAAAGPALGGLLVAGAGVREALLADAASFFIVALLLAAARRLPRAETEAAGWSQRLRNGLRYTRERPVVGMLLAAEAVAFLFGAAVIPIEVVFAKETLDAGDAGYGALLTSWGAGMVLGSMLFAAVRRRSLRLLLIASTGAIGLSYVVAGLAPTLLVACLAFIVGGLGNGVQWVALISALQELSRPAMHARVIALLESSTSAMLGAGFLLGGALTSLSSTRATFVVSGIGVAAVIAIAIGFGRRVPWERDPGIRPPPTPLPARPADAHRPPDLSPAEP